MTLSRFPPAPARTHWSRAGLAAALAVLLLSTAMADDVAAPTGGPGVWQNHKYTFQFMGFTTTYSCDGLADKLRKLLLAAGARSDVKSQPGACAAGFGRPDKFARADLDFLYARAGRRRCGRCRAWRLAAGHLRLSVAAGPRDGAIASWSSNSGSWCCRCSPRATWSATPPASRIRNRARPSI